jgi:transcription elongation factor Elf1
MDYLEEKYLSFVSGRLRNFKRKSSNLYNFSCPFCNDSNKSAKKARAYIISKNNTSFFYCHKCNAPVGNFTNFLKQIDYSLFLEFLQEKFGKEKKSDFEVVTPTFKSYNADRLNDLFPVTELSDFDAMKIYVKSRKIPEEYHSRIYSCPNFKKFTNSIIPNKFETLEYDEDRLLIPFFDENKKMFAYTGRSIKANSKLRYVNIVLDESKPKIFGLDKWNKNEHTNVVEGPIDSMFLPNCIATSGGSLISNFRKFDKEQFTIIYDNEPDSLTTKEKIKKAIAEGFPVCVWPKTVRQKDINSMVLSGMTSEKIIEIIKDNTFKGLEAFLKISF